MRNTPFDIYRLLQSILNPSQGKVAWLQYKLSRKWFFFCWSPWSFAYPTPLNANNSSSQLWTNAVRHNWSGLKISISECILIRSTAKSRLGVCVMISFCHSKVSFSYKTYSTKALIYCYTYIKHWISILICKK